VKLLLELSMECESLARSEALCAARVLGMRAEVVDHGPGVLLLDTDADPTLLAERAALCHTISEHLGSHAPDELESVAADLDLQGPVRVHATRVGTHHPEVRLESVNRVVGGIVGRSSGVDIHNPSSELRVVYSDRVHLGRRLASVDRSSYERRMAKNLPYDRPISLHPKYARCLVNLALVRRGERLLDPFCGTGAIVAEAALAGCRAAGSDLSAEMVDGTRANLDSMGLTADLAVSDVGEVKDGFGRVEGIATDPPYGRSTSTCGEQIPLLFKRAFESFAALLDVGRRAAIIVHDPALASSVDGFALIESHELWVHRSLTRRFCVLERL
jgi:tRNA (guanine10-N2)-dimethyltransferase